jgi:hypothetical protein
MKYDRLTLIKFGSPEVIEKEAKVYNIVKGIKGVPKLYNWCTYNDTGYLSMERCGVDLERCLQENGTLSLEDALMVANVVVSRLPTAHI